MLTHLLKAVGSILFPMLTHLLKAVGSILFPMLTHLLKAVGSISFLMLTHLLKAVGSISFKHYHWLYRAVQCRCGLVDELHSVNKTISGSNDKLLHMLGGFIVHKKMVLLHLGVCLY